MKTKERLQRLERSEYIQDNDAAVVFVVSDYANLPQVFAPHSKPFFIIPDNGRGNTAVVSAADVVRIVRTDK